MNRFKTLPILLSLLASPVFAADAPSAAPKIKILDAFHTIDPKSVKLYDIKAKPVTTPDPAHTKVLDLSADFSKKGTWPRLEKSFSAGLINPAKYQAVRFFAKSDVDTTVSVHLSEAARVGEKRYLDYYVKVKGTNTWTEVILPFSDFKTYEDKVWVKGVQTVYPAGRVIEANDYGLLTTIKFVCNVEDRGTSTEAHFQVDGFGLLEK